MMNELVVKSVLVVEEAGVPGENQRLNFITCGCESSASCFVIYKAGREPTPNGYIFFEIILSWSFNGFG